MELTEVITVASDIRINVHNELITSVEVLDGANNKSFNFLISNLKLVFFNSKDHHFPGFGGLITESNLLDTVQMKVSPHFHPPDFRVLCYYSIINHFVL